MKLLLDTQVLIWIFGQQEKLSAQAVEFIQDKNNELFVSIVSLWEIAIKIKLGKLNLPVELSQFIADVTANDIEILNIETSHLLHLTSLPLHHRDPFDRLIISQGMVEKLRFISSDKAFVLYPITNAW
ncbi:MAG: type II toxin-antitoxin system VapC family toxin [Bacteroidota bacterium]